MVVGGVQYVEVLRELLQVGVPVRLQSHTVIFNMLQCVERSALPQVQISTIFTWLSGKK